MTKKEEWIADSIINPCYRCPYRDCIGHDHCVEYLKYFRRKLLD